MDLNTAKLCLDCEEVFESALRCPRCGSESCHPLRQWVKPLGEASGRVMRGKNLLVPIGRPGVQVLSEAAV